MALYIYGLNPALGYTYTVPLTSACMSKACRILLLKLHYSACIVCFSLSMLKDKDFLSVINTHLSSTVFERDTSQNLERSCSQILSLVLASSHAKGPYSDSASSGEDSPGIQESPVGAEPRRLAPTPRLQFGRGLSLRKRGMTDTCYALLKLSIVASQWRLEHP